MPLGIVSDKEFEQEKNSLIKNPVPKPIGEVIDINNPGRKEGDLNVPNGLRKVIADTAINDGREEAIEFARNFGISASSVSAYQQGATSTSTYDERPNASHVNEVKEKISKSARIKLKQALKHITNDKLSEAKPRELAGIARDMSAIIKDMEPDEPIKESGKSGPTFVLYSPQVREEKIFDVIQVKE